MRFTLILVALVGASVQAGAAVSKGVETSAVPYRQSDLGAFLDLGIGASIAGDNLVGDVGVESLGMRSLADKWLLQWDGLLAVRMGGLANQHPYFFFAGGTARGALEVGYRLFPDASWSPYLSGKLNAQLQVMGTPGVSIRALNTINSSDGFGGVLANGAARASVGISYLTAEHSLLIVAFGQERLRAAQVVAPAAAFTDVGIGARYDLTHSLTLQLEFSAGTTRAVPNYALHSTDQTVNAEILGGVRKWFGSGLWLSLGLSYGRELHRVFYLDTHTEYGSIGPPNFTTTATVGFAFSRDR